MKLLKPIRLTLGIVVLISITLLFLDFTGTIHPWLGWLAKIQLLPAILAGNAVIVVVLLLLTLLLGRVYCSVICPLGLFQDAVAMTNRKRNKYSYSKAISWLRYGVFALFIIAFVLGISWLVALLDPYSAYGRMVQNLFSPLYIWGNNALAFLAERADSYRFYTVDVWIKSVSTFVVAAITLVGIVIFSYRNGRTYCNTICPVGTLLGLLSRFSLMRVQFTPEQCNGCGKCSRNCKAACIDSKNKEIDYSRCVSCFNCIESCPKGGMRYELRRRKAKAAPVEEQVDVDKRQAMATLGVLAVSSGLKAQTVKMDGGLAFIEDKKVIKRETIIVPAGGKGLRHFDRHCTGCQLCVTVCPNKALKPSSCLDRLMQPSLSYELGYCRPECVKCSEVCPTGAIVKIDQAEKSSTQIGHAVWVEQNCVVLTDGVSCGNCERHCPVGAITMIEREMEDYSTAKVPMIDVERCIGCGACEYLCPSRPFSAIYVEGHRMHRNI